MVTDVRSCDTRRARHTNLTGYLVTSFPGIYDTFSVTDVAPFIADKELDYYSDK